MHGDSDTPNASTVEEDLYVEFHALAQSTRRTVARVRIVRTSSGRIAVVTELFRNPGPSITTAAESVYSELRDRFEPLAGVIEHYPGGDDSHFDEVTFDPLDGRFAGWRPLRDGLGGTPLAGVDLRHDVAHEPAWLDLAEAPAPLSPAERLERDLSSTIADVSERAWRAQIVARVASEPHYEAALDASGQYRIVRVDVGGTVPIAHIVRHSPTGMRVGYAGSGAADAARSILADALGLAPTEGGSLPELDALYQTFKREIIAGLPFDGPWSLAVDAVRAWYAPRAPRLCDRHRFPLGDDGACADCLLRERP